MTTCLIVDDSSTQRKIIRKIVEDASLDIVEAEDGQKALEVCENNMPDSIILDMYMPNMNGIEFLIALKDIPSPFKPYIIICSAEVDTDAIVLAVKSGADAYHCKSSDVNNLRAKINKLADL